MLDLARVFCVMLFMFRKFHFVFLFFPLSGHYADVVVVISQSDRQTVRQTERQTDV